MGHLSVVSLFTGAGGLDLGFHAAGFRTRVAVEMDQTCCRTLRANVGRKHKWQVIEAPVETVPSAAILDAAGLKPGEADILIGGPPCQPFSKSGYWSKGDSGRLSDPRANTLAEYMRVLRDTRPRAFLLENVSGLAYSGKEEGFQFLLREIESINRKLKTKYTISAKVLNAADYGVPQTRERIILIGSRDGTVFEFPKPRFANPSHEPDFFPVLPPYRTSWDALGDLGTPKDLDETRPRGRWAELLPTIPEGENYLFHTDRGSGWPLFGWRRRYWSFLLKLAKNRPAWTLTAQPGPAIGPFHWESRRLARRELMRIQTFPDDYLVEGALHEVHKQVGNAVPSLLAEVLALEIRRQFFGHRVKSDSPTLIPPKRTGIPAPEAIVDLPNRYRPLIGSHEPHPGTGRGYGANRRSA